MPGLLLRPMHSRDTEEPHRASTPLELFFDLTFVVGVSFGAVGLAHQVESGHAARGFGVFAMVFFAIWWGWLNFTWFASVYDTDDWLYRVITLVQMGGALTVAAGIPRVFEHNEFGVVVAGYVIMRLAMVFQWLRAARDDPARRATALTYVVGITVVQVLWVLRLTVPEELGVLSFVVLVLAELAVPYTAERRSVLAFHREHVAERYGLFTIIVLGEGVLAVGNSIIEAIQEGEHVASLVMLAIGGLTLLAGMWWLYFTGESTDELASLPKSFAWGYGHYVIFAAAAAVSGGIEVQIASVTGTSHAEDLTARLVVSLPAAVFVVFVWALVVRPAIEHPTHGLVLIGAVALGVLGFVPLSLPVSAVASAVILGLIVAVLVVTNADDQTLVDTPGG